MAQTLYDKLWDAHLVEQRDDGTALIYIDRHLLHEVTSPQAFEGLKLAGRDLWRRSANLAVPDHNVSTLRSEREGGLQALPDEVSRIQLQTLDDNCAAFDVAEIPLNDIRQGIVHVMGPEQGAVLPGMTVVCGDSHTSTHGAAGALAHGIGTSEVEHVMATQCLIQRKMKNFRVEVTGNLQLGVTAKDVALAVIGAIGTAGGTGFAIEFCGSAISALSMEGRMTLCNMAIEAGARCGLVAVDDVTLDYFRDKPFAPTGEQWQQAEAWWRTLRSDEGAVFDQTLTLDGSAIEPHVTWGTSPEMVTSVNGRVPTLEDMPDETSRLGLARVRHPDLDPIACPLGRPRPRRRRAHPAPHLPHPDPDPHPKRQLQVAQRDQPPPPAVDPPVRRREARHRRERSGPDQHQDRSLRDLGLADRGHPPRRGRRLSPHGPVAA